MANRYFDWVVKTTAQRFVNRDTERSKDINAALDLVTAGFDLLPRGIVCSAFSAVNQSVPNASVDTKIVLGTETYDPDNTFAASRFTVPANAPGYYFVIGQIDWPAGAGATTIDAAIFKNGAVFARGQKYTGEAPNAVRTAICIPMLLAAADFIELYGQHNSTAARNALSGQNTHLSIMQVRANGAQG